APAPEPAHCASSAGRRRFPQWARPRPPCEDRDGQIPKAAILLTVIAAQGQTFVLTKPRLLQIEILADRRILANSRLLQALANSRPLQISDFTGWTKCGLNGAGACLSVGQ